ncbi:hypothetical protein [Pseudomonas sp. MWU12-2345]|uniref:hypothetical protein n=1 Tax=Pseudomonas sp. MWU12-2345 TaxID=2928689 RepID=UPI00200EC35F|nr:hypothetical protein [Pseudomonas sp. MWU12-2345]
MDYQPIFGTYEIAGANGSLAQPETHALLNPEMFSHAETFGSQRGADDLTSAHCAEWKFGALKAIKSEKLRGSSQNRTGFSEIKLLTRWLIVKGRRDFPLLKRYHDFRSQCMSVPASIPQVRPG